MQDIWLKAEDRQVKQKNLQPGGFVSPSAVFPVFNPESVW